MDTLRNWVSPAIRTSLSPVKLAPKIDHPRDQDKIVAQACSIATEKPTPNGPLELHAAGSSEGRADLQVALVMGRGSWVFPLQLPVHHALRATSMGNHSPAQSTVLDHSVEMQGGLTLALPELPAARNLASH